MPSPSCKRLALGPRGKRLYLFEQRPGGPLYRRLGQGSATPLGHTDWDRAEREAYQLLGLIDTPQQDRLTLGQLVVQYLASGKVANMSVRYRMKHLPYHLRQLLTRWGTDRLVHSLSRNDFDTFIADSRAEGLGDQTIRHRLGAMKAACGWAVLEGILGKHPFYGYRLLAEKAPLRAIVSHELHETLIRHASPVLYRFLTLLDATGRRFRELAELRWEDVHVAQGTIHFRATTNKTRKAVTIPAPVDVLGPPGEGLVFPEFHGVHQNFYRHLKAAAKRAGIVLPTGVGSHSWRRKWVTERRDHNLADLVAAGGWASSQMVTDVYMKTDQARMDDVVLRPTRRVTDAGIQVLPVESRQKVGRTAPKTRRKTRANA